MKALIILFILAMGMALPIAAEETISPEAINGEWEGRWHGNWWGPCKVSINAKNETLKGVAETSTGDSRWSGKYQIIGNKIILDRPGKYYHEYWLEKTSDGTVILKGFYRVTFTNIRGTFELKKKA